MNKKKPEQFIGKKGHVYYGGFGVAITIIDYRELAGRPQVLVKSSKGTPVWKYLTAVELD